MCPAGLFLLRSCWQEETREPVQTQPRSSGGAGTNTALGSQDCSATLGFNCYSNKGPPAQKRAGTASEGTLKICWTNKRYKEEFSLSNSSSLPERLLQVAASATQTWLLGKTDLDGLFPFLFSLFFSPLLSFLLLSSLFSSLPLPFFFAFLKLLLKM